MNTTQLSQGEASRQKYWGNSNNTNGGMLRPYTRMLRPDHYFNLYE